jgi:hypothetical protein
MITKEQYVEQHAQLYALLNEIWGDDGQVVLYYGWGEGTGDLFGWWKVVPDYPNYLSTFLAEDFEVALAAVSEEYEEWLSEQEENEEEEEENDDWNTPDPSEDGMEPIEEIDPLYEPYDYVKDDYNYDANREKGR